MSIKENLNAIKRGISTEEQFLEGFIRGERIFRKYRKYLFAILILIVVGVAGYLINDYMSKAKLEKANVAYLNLLNDANSTADVEVFKNNNKSLYSLYLYQNAMKNNDIATLSNLASNSSNKVIKDLSSFYVALSSGDDKKINKYTKDGKIFPEYARLNEVVLLLKSGEIEKAKRKLESFGFDSTLSEYTNMLKHYK